MAIATGTALAIAALTAGGTSVYQQKSANTTNKRAQTQQAQESNTAAQIERERLAEDREARQAALAEQTAARESAIQRDKERWQDYLRINEPYWQAGSGVLRSLYDLAGLPGAPAYAQPTMPVPGAGAPPPVSGSPPVSTIPPGERRPPVAGSSTRGGVLPQPSMQPIPISQLMELAKMAGSSGTQTPRAIPSLMQGF